MPTDIITGFKNTLCSMFGPALRSINGGPCQRVPAPSQSGRVPSRAVRRSMFGSGYYATAPQTQVKFNADSATVIRRNPPAQTYEGRHINGIYFN